MNAYGLDRRSAVLGVFARCKCLGANVLRGPDQIPWDGKLNYDYQLWIDSDIVFNTEKFYQLVLLDKDLASGWYCTEDGQTTSVAHWMEEDDFRNNGGVMNHETLETMGKRKKPIHSGLCRFRMVAHQERSV